MTKITHIVVHYSATYADQNLTVKDIDNTLLQLATLAGMIVGGTAIWVNASRDIEEPRAWRNSHEQMHKDSLAEVKAVEAVPMSAFCIIEAEVTSDLHWRYCRGWKRGIAGRGERSPLYDKETRRRVTGGLSSPIRHSYAGAP